MRNKDQHIDDLQIMNKGQEDQEAHVGSENANYKMSFKSEIRCRKLKEFKNQMSPKEAIRRSTDIILGKLALWLVQNFNICSYSLTLTHGKMRVTVHDVHVMLGLPKGLPEFISLLSHWKQQWPKRYSISKCAQVIVIMWGQVDGGEDFRRNFVMLVMFTCLSGWQIGELCYLDRVVFKLKLVPNQFATLRGWTNGKIKYREFVIGFGIGYLEDTMDKTTITNEEEEVNKVECNNKNDEDKVKAEDETLFFMMVRRRPTR
ncbi:LOW QUALITY PROTEIN: hypothetical protein Cgig2_025556 [Carnegiea gigantea]|uniref:Uncharacterized protein n=1 Tax=Carnegiea gigantea TaxID=171969 RepID=A0A9Q1GJD2_9CARY|nr:LOW QUALITY PROTEIN: hypothetical protein Cgig2_025556 [Carnegiea gigantea]